MFPKQEKYSLSIKAYKNVFDSLYTSLCVFASSYVGNIDVAKDLVQDVFIKVWEDKIDFKSELAVKSYLYTAVKNRALDFLKSKRFKATDHMSVVELDHLNKESFYLKEVVIEEAATVIEEAIKTLPNRCAQIMRLSIKELTNIEIAKQLEISVNTVKAQKKIAYKRLRPLLKEHFVLIAFVFSSSN
ncbi:RNA polymerase sigma-70 factor [Winogradskyella sp. F6397]|uniref:RNA polymerase sigma-70 factor n=1 Tax=Winogradskyella marina TaxID=2785530 RepID=A0ABS0EK13_9FLAO|nr:RNA polymerase sigma-70 factor [Winogradskyella marina]MBF8150744.1 RNA polymerase sigma-70 factor [Winogradskyella marina]